jgi:ATP-dependent DNA helicase RecG
MSQDVRFLTGVGPHRAELLQKLDIRTVADLLWHLPRELLDLTEVRQPGQLVEGELQTVRGTVVDMDARQLTRGRTLTAGLLDCGSGYVRGVWFNQPWMLQRLRCGHVVLFSGKPKRAQGRWEFAHPRIQWLETDDAGSHGGLLPKYGLTEGLTMQEMRRMMRAAVDLFADLIADALPAGFRERERLLPLADALRALHAPRTVAEHEAGRRRVLFDDLFEFQLGLALRRRTWTRHRAAPRLECTSKIDARIRRLFPFRLTEGQNQAVGEIAADLASGRAMHRLLQADVGAGKTVIAIYAMLVAVAGGHQAALMAPTELLANQHWDTIDALLAGSRVERVLLTGSLSTVQRRNALERIRAGDVQIVVGTQALIQEDVAFERLGLVVIDEQHKFGVAQRARFSLATSAGDSVRASHDPLAEREDYIPHVLVMTATPIPRSLCLTAFGDLDLTVVRELPPGRQRVVTSRIRGRDAQAKAWDFCRRQLRAGRQAYVVCPRIESESDTARDAAADKVHEYLARTELRDFRLGLVHGRMDRGDQAAVMDRFRDHELDVVVSTTVVEVGVDVPNATLMVILHAERYGLAQLHQLRGRIARGKFQGYCFLFSDADSEEAHERLAAIEASADGFEIAEKDFALRGPGDVLGTRQHGDLPLRAADLVRDAALLDEARTAAVALVESGNFDQPEYAPLKVRVLDRFGRLFDLPQSG